MENAGEYVVDNQEMIDIFNEFNLDELVISEEDLIDDFHVAEEIDDIGQGCPHWLYSKESRNLFQNKQNMKIHSNLKMMTYFCL
jgi:hypothetical protein